MTDTNAVLEAVNAISDLANGFGGTNSIAALAKGVAASQPTDWVKLTMEATALVTGLVTLLGVLGRIYHCIVTGGGIVGSFKAVVFGTNAPKGVVVAPVDIAPPKV